MSPLEVATRGIKKEELSAQKVEKQSKFKESMKK